MKGIKGYWKNGKPVLRQIFKIEKVVGLNNKKPAVAWHNNLEVRSLGLFKTEAPPPMYPQEHGNRLSYRSVGRHQSARSTLSASAHPEMTA